MNRLPHRAITRFLTVVLALLVIQSWRPDGKLATYNATRPGAWNETRGYSTGTTDYYTARGQLLTEPFAPANGASGAYAYQFDAGTQTGPDVRTAASYTALQSDSVPAGGENPLAQVLAETNLPGDGTTQSIGSHYDLMGELDTRTVSQQINGAPRTVGAQTLAWDGFGRLVGVQQRDASQNGFDWTALYDPFGRRIRTITWSVSAGLETGPPTTVDSFYDPQVEFLELGVAVQSSAAVAGANPGARTWKVYGPDLNGTYGGLQGIGGLEAAIDETSGAVTPVINDAFGNVVGSVSGSSMVWNAPEVGGYGLLPGSTPHILEGGATMAQATVWRGHRLDPTGYYYLGARYYDPQGGRFISPDPLGHGSSIALYDYAGGDPVNRCDPDGRMGSSIMQNGDIDAGNAFIGAGETISGSAQAIATGLTNLATNPVGTVENAADGVYNATSAAGAYLGARSVDGDFSGIKNAASNGWNNFINNPEEAAHTIGQIAGGVEVGLATAGATAVVTETAAAFISGVTTVAEVGAEATAVTTTVTVGEEVAAGSGPAVVEATGAAESVGEGEAALIGTPAEATVPVASQAPAAVSAIADGASAAAGDAAETTVGGGVPTAMRSGQLAEGPILDSLGSTGKVTFTPTPDQINSAAFNVIVGDARYTASGTPVSTILDGSTASGLAEVKTGSSMLNSTYQLRLQTYASLITDQPLTIYTSRPINSTFSDWLTRWGVSVQPLPSVP